MNRFIIDCGEEAIVRVCFTSQVSPEHLDAYREAHSAVWPEMLEALRDCGWGDYHLYLRPDGLLIGFVELADGYSAAQARMAATEVNARWQAAMSQLFATNGAPDEGMTLLDEIFHLESQLAALGLPTEPAAQTEPGEPGEPAASGKPKASK
ncbi:MAG: L-rhamnose mutarotase [Bifidobacteriaceae bacterium]|nr:L-rhamnose mutarotase [Bifidobacteriaceae bacterium]